MEENIEKTAIDEILDNHRNILHDLERLTQVDSDDLNLIIELQKDTAEAIDRILDPTKHSK